jgi:hypothetical protein
MAPERDSHASKHRKLSFMSDTTSNQASSINLLTGLVGVQKAQLSGTSPRWSRRSVLITTVSMTNLVADTIASTTDSDDERPITEG